MKFLKIGVLSVLALVVGIFGLQIVASESAEVVVLTTSGDAGSEDTRLWVVEHEGAQYLRAQEGSGWYVRLVAAPEVTFERGSVAAPYRAETDPDAGEVINGLMQEKYGWRDSYVSWLIGGREGAIAVKLIPMT